MDCNIGTVGIRNIYRKGIEWTKVFKRIDPDAFA